MWRSQFWGLKLLHPVWILSSMASPECPGTSATGLGHASTRTTKCRLYPAHGGGDALRPPQHSDAPKGSRSRTWIALIVVFTLIGAILGFLVWRNQPADPVGFEKGASDVRSIRQAVATARW